MRGDGRMSSLAKRARGVAGRMTMTKRAVGKVGRAVSSRSGASGRLSALKKKIGT